MTLPVGTNERERERRRGRRSGVEEVEEEETKEEEEKQRRRSTGDRGRIDGASEVMSNMERGSGGRGAGRNIEVVKDIVKKIKKNKW